MQTVAQIFCGNDRPGTELTSSHTESLPLPDPEELVPDPYPDPDPDPDPAPDPPPEVPAKAPVTAMLSNVAISIIFFVFVVMVVSCLSARGGMPLRWPGA